MMAVKERPRREQPVGLGRYRTALGAAQEPARPNDVFLPDELIQGARPHAGRQRGFVLHTLLHGMGEEVHTSNYTRLIELNFKGHPKAVMGQSYRLFGP
jgi:hypothetical protein